MKPGPEKRLPSNKVQSSTNLADWDDVETDIAGNGGSIVRFYSIEGIPQRSFRAVEQ